MKWMVAQEHWAEGLLITKSTDHRDKTGIMAWKCCNNINMNISPYWSRKNLLKVADVIKYWAFSATYTIPVLGFRFLSHFDRSPIERFPLWSWCVCFMLACTSQKKYAATTSQKRNQKSWKINCSAFGIVIMTNTADILVFTELKKEYIFFIVTYIVQEAGEIYCTVLDWGCFVFSLYLCLCPCSIQDLPDFTPERNRNNIG